MHVGALEASSGGQVMWDELGVGHRAPRACMCTGGQADMGGMYVEGWVGLVCPYWGDQSLRHMDMGQMDRRGFVVGMLIPC